MTEIIEKIRTAYPGFSAAKRMVAAYFMNHYESLHYATLAELAEAIGVSDTTIINFCSELGYSGFSGFKRVAREAVHRRPTDLNNPFLPSDQSVMELVKPVVTGIRETFFDAENDHALQQGASSMAAARRVIAVGFHAQAAMAQEFCLQLRRMGRDAMEIIPGLGDYIDKVRWFTGDDFAVVFDFAPYSTGTMEIVQSLKERAVPILLVTDMGACPCAEACRWAVRCRGMLPCENQWPIEGCGVSAGVIVGYVLRTLAQKIESPVCDQYEELRDGVFSQFNPYGKMESKQW